MKKSKTPLIGAFWINQLSTGYSLSAISIFRHEFFHVFQDVHYPGGIEQYHENGFPNIEFEQALFKDITSGEGNEIAMGPSASIDLQKEYSKWLASITNNFNTSPKQFSDFQNKYYYFLDKFYQESSYAGRGKINYNLLPNALLNIFSISNCK